jgi:hypothetical protein
MWNQSHILWAASSTGIPSLEHKRYHPSLFCRERLAGQWYCLVFRQAKRHLFHPIAYQDSLLLSVCHSCSCDGQMPHVDERCNELYFCRFLGYLLIRFGLLCGCGQREELLWCSDSESHSGSTTNYKKGFSYGYKTLEENTSFVKGRILFKIKFFLIIMDLTKFIAHLLKF